MTPEQASGHGMQAHVGKNLGGTLAFMSEDFLHLFSQLDHALKNAVLP